VAETDAEQALQILQEAGETAWRLGRIETNDATDAPQIEISGSLA
jgi:phosphoribosylaminoimidazole (AIR) synthetase